MLESSVSPLTQGVDAVVGLLNGLGRPIEPLPEVVDLGSVKLVLSNKKDVYYTTTAKACSCPSATYRGGPCKHIRKYFRESKRRGQTIEETLAEHDKNLHKMPKSYQRMVRASREAAESEPGLISHGGFRPVMPEDEEQSPIDRIDEISMKDVTDIRVSNQKGNTKILSSPRFPSHQLLLIQIAKLQMSIGILASGLAYVIPYPSARRDFFIQASRW